MKSNLRYLSIFFTLAALIFTAAVEAQEPKVVPFPKKIKMSDGRLVLKPHCSIVAKDPSLLALANVAKEDIAQLFGLECQVVQNDSKTGGIQLVIDPQLKEEEYRINVGDRAIVAGGGLKGVAWGVTTLLQAAMSDGETVVVLRMSIGDWPDAAYRGLMIDLARKWHPIDVVKQTVVLCQWYKIGYLQLHFTDDQSWTFPVKSYPKLATPDRQYTLEELRDLESFAAARGVAIMPEIEAPGHGGALIRALPDEVRCEPFKADSVALCPSRESTYRVMEAVVGEVCQIFKTSPYFHIGADEVDKSGWAKCNFCKQYREQNKIDDDEELYRLFINRMNDIVKKHGKRTLLWEGFKVAGKTPIPKDVTVMEFESFYELPQNYVAAGYSVINTAWQPLYVVNDACWPPSKIYSWNMYRWEHFFEKSAAYPNGIDVPPTPLILGAQMCAWEQPPAKEIPSLRQRLAAMSERLWDRAEHRAFEDFSARLESTDDKLSKLLPKSSADQK